MATINYSTVLSLTDESNILLSNPNTPPTTFSPINLEQSNLSNMITAQNYEMDSTEFPTSPLPCSFTLNSVTGGFGATYSDAVYHYQSSIALSDDYVSDAYLLVTTAIDAAIAGLPAVTDLDIVRKTQLVAWRADVDTYFNAANYTDANNQIEFIEIILAALGVAEEPITVVLTLDNPTTFSADITPQTPGTFALQGAWFNIITNTLTGDEYPYTWEWDIETGGSNSVVNSVNYPDGVYTTYNSDIWAGTIFVTKLAFVYGGTAYALVTTGLQAGIPLWQDAFNALVNPTPTQIANNATLNTILADINTAFSANLYSQANDLIEQAQAILNGGIGIAMYLALATTGTKAYKEANMLNYFETGSLPSGTYADQVSILTNTITGEETAFPSTYPASNTDYTETLNSADLVEDTKWTDGVYRSNVEFTVDEVLYQCLAYCLVTTSMDCVITKLTQSADTCKSLQSQLGKLRSLRSMAIDSFNAGNYTGANNAVKKFQQQTSTCNCGCR